MKDDPLQIWADALSTRAEGTKKVYLQHFSKFLGWCQLSAKEIRRRKLEEEEDKDKKPWQRIEVENLVRRYLRHLESEGYSGSTQQSALVSIRSFFDAQQLPLHLNRQDFPSDCAHMHASSVPTREDIKKMLDAAQSIRDRALILFLKDSGLRESDLEQLRWKDLKEWPDGFLGFQLMTKKKKTKARPFVGPETTEVLEIYKRARLQGTQKIPPEKNLLEHPVFSLLYDGSKPLQPKCMSSCIGDIIKRAGLEGLTPHGLRKFWEQNVHTEKTSHQKQLNGRKLSSDEQAYEWKTMEELFIIFRQNYSNLRLTESVSEEVEKLKQEYEEKISVLRSELHILRERLERAISLAVHPWQDRASIEELIRASIAEEFKKRGIPEKWISKE